MAASDWSRSYFSYNGDTPNFLPEIFRLPSGFTRNSNNCELSEVLSAGYTGPFPEPPAPGDYSTVSWDSVSETWVITKISDNPPYEAYLESKQTCAYIRSLLDGCPSDLCNSDLTEKYQQQLFAYYGELFYLLHLCETHGQNITMAELPSLPNDELSTISKVQQQQSAWLEANYNDCKNFYETQGLLPGDIDFSYFEVPSGWVLGSDQINPVTIFKPFFIPSGYEISVPILGASGYYVLVPSGIDTVSSGLTGGN